MATNRFLNFAACAAATVLLAAARPAGANAFLGEPRFQIHRLFDGRGARDIYVSGDGPAKIENPGPVSVTAQGGDAKLLSLEVHELKSIW